MAAVYPNGAETIIANYVVGKTGTTEPLTLRLYTNNYTPIETTVVGNLTEATATGYAAISLTGASWSTTDGVSDYAQQTFTFTAAETCYGYYLTRTTGGELIAAELFSDGPYVVPSGGGTIKVTPQVTVS